MLSFDFFVTGTDCSTLTVPFARPIFDCVSVEMLDGYVEHATPATVGPVFVREANIERRLFPDLHSEPVPNGALGCVFPTSSVTPMARSVPMTSHFTVDGLRRLIKLPFPLTALDLVLTDIANQPVTVSRAVLHMRILQKR